MAATLTDLINDTLSHLAGYTSDTDQVATLAFDLDASTTGFYAGGSDQLSRGLIEIGDELMAVDTVDATTNIVTLYLWGRAQQGSTAATHTGGSKITMSPRFPRARVKTVVNEVLNSIYPDVYAVKTTTVTMSGSRVGYELPADLEGLLDVRVEPVGPSREWQTVSRFRLDLRADTTTFPSGVAIDILSPLATGRRVKITYVAPPGQLSASTDLLTGTGLSENCRDIITMSAASVLLSAAEASRTADDSVEQADYSKRANPGAATIASQALDRRVTARIAQERTRLLRLFPPITHFQR